MSCPKRINNMNDKKHPFIILLNLIIFSVIILLQYTDKAFIRINGVSPLLILPLITAFSMFHSPLASALAGMIAGIFMDSVTVGSHGFNAVILLIIGVFVSCVSSNLFNKNLPSCVVLTLIISFLYHICHCIVFHTFGTRFTETVTYLLEYSLPSVLLGTVFIFPFYFIYKHFHKLKSN